MVCVRRRVPREPTPALWVSVVRMTGARRSAMLPPIVCLGKCVVAAFVFPAVVQTRTVLADKCVVVASVDVRLVSLSLRPVVWTQMNVSPIRVIEQPPVLTHRVVTGVFVNPTLWEIPI
uniref:Uncharacterized protein n=1 Tax=Cacopsylla melanoneura TaxID=428564 RepID=A0A8D9DN30_9HEMI